MAEENLNMKSVSIEQFTKVIKEQFEDENYEPIIGIGKSGVGKTESIFELTKELGIGFCELRLVTMTETDLIGIPVVKNNVVGKDEQGNDKIVHTTTYAANDILPREDRDGVKGILVLDEITSCSSTIRAAAYQLLDSKRALGEYRLPKDWIVVALGNGPDDGGCFAGMENAFLNRGACLRIEPDLKTWKRWAIKKGVSSTILAFLTMMPEYLHCFNADEIASVFPSPRSWTKLSTTLNNREKRTNGKPLETDSVDTYAASCVGLDVGSKFTAFYDYNRQLVDIEEIMSGTAETNLGEIPVEVRYIIMSNISKQITEETKTYRGIKAGNKDTALKRMSNACNWLIAVGRNYSLDFAAMVFSELGNTNNDFSNIAVDDEKFDEYCPEFVKFAMENSLVFK